MFLGSRATVLEGLHKLGLKHCSYSWGGKWADRCDCKYGVTGGEATGCPELRSLHEIVSAMTDEEWAMLMARGENVPSGLFSVTQDTLEKRLFQANARVQNAALALSEAAAFLSLEPEERANAS